MHKLLERQIRRILEDRTRVPEEFLEAVGAAYAQADEDRRLLERSMELTSEELLERNEALSRSLSLLQATLEATEDGILVSDRNQRIVSYNQRFVALWDHPLDILERRDGKASAEHAANQLVDPDAFRERLAEFSVQPEEEASDEIEMKSGRWMEYFTRPMRHDGEVLGRVWSFRDITEKRQLEEQIRQTQKMEAIGQLAGGIAHDFNNLLTVILGSCELLQHQVDSNPKVDRLLGEINAASRRASDLTSQLLTFSRRGVLDPEALVVDQAIHEMEGMLQRLIRENIALSTHLDAQGACILADRGRFHQIVLNLVINASDALAQGGEIEIHTAVIDLPLPESLGSTAEEVTEPGPSRHLRLTVRDNGCGIPLAIQQRIFEPFFTTKPAGQGTGLGLATVYGIMGQFGGALELDSTPGVGTEFRLAFPLTKHSARPDHRAVSHELSGTGTIVAVEDNPAVRLVLAEMLARLEDFETLVFGSPAEALKHCAHHPEPIDLLVSDIVMPEMNGFELAAALVEQYPQLKVLFVSGYDPTASSDWSIANEPHAAFLSKPFNWETLVATIYEVLATAEPYRPGLREMVEQEKG